MMRSPTTIGLEAPAPGTLSFQRMLSFSSCAGTDLSSDAPLPSPRKPGQSLAQLGPNKTKAASIVRQSRMTICIANLLGRNGVQKRGNPRATWRDYHILPEMKGALRTFIPLPRSTEGEG